MKLYDYLSMHKGFVDFDVPDTEIDTVMYVGFDKDTDDVISKDYPNMDKFVSMLFKKVDIAYFNQDHVPVCDFYGFIHKNEDLWKEHIKKYWREDLQWLLEDDSGEFEYELIKEFDNVVGGRYGESINKQYYKTLSKCKE